LTEDSRTTDFPQGCW